MDAPHPCRMLLLLLGALVQPASFAERQWNARRGVGRGDA
jgi:hypothetical protein